MNFFTLKAALLHKGNKRFSIALGHPVDTGGTYESMSLILKAISYVAYNWQGKSQRAVFCVFRTVEQHTVITK